MTTLDSVIYMLKKYSKILFAVQKDPSNILAVIPENAFIRLVENSTTELLDFQYLERRKTWLDIHMVMTNESVPYYITFRIHNPTENISTKLMTKYPSSSSFI
ncbi:MAG: hypothetical protein ACTSW1_19465 [Candidatus Hodarchaeales archaeon]